jgi:hypothetical protein
MMKPITSKLFNWRMLLMLLCYWQISNAEIIDSTNITTITAAAHPQHPNPLQKPGTPVLSFDYETTRSGRYGVFTQKTDLKTTASTDSANLLQGIAANPLAENLTQFNYSQIDVVRAKIKVDPAINN